MQAVLAKLWLAAALFGAALIACDSGGTTAPSTPVAHQLAAQAAPVAAPAASAAPAPSPILLVDVRTPGEYDAGHVLDAVNVPLGTLRSQLDELGPRDEPIAVYCRSGSRSAHAAALLRAAGFQLVTDLGTRANAAAYLESL